MKSAIPEHAQKVFSGQIFEVFQWPQTLYDGSVATFEKLKRADSSGVLPITPEDKILITHQEQPTIEPFWGLLGGIVDPGETPLQAAQRELLEEAGVVATDWQEWFSVQPHTKIIWNIHAFVARNAQITTEPHLDGGEKIEVHAVRFEEFLKIAQQEDFRDGEVTFAVLQALVDPQKMATLKKLLFG